MSCFVVCVSGLFGSQFARAGSAWAQIPSVWFRYDPGSRRLGCLIKRRVFLFRGGGGFFSFKHSTLCLCACSCARPRTGRGPHDGPQWDPGAPRQGVCMPQCKCSKRGLSHPPYPRQLGGAALACLRRSCLPWGGGSSGGEAGAGGSDGVDRFRQ